MEPRIILNSGKGTLTLDLGPRGMEGLTSLEMKTLDMPNVLRLRLWYTLGDAGKLREWEYILPAQERTNPIKDWLRKRRGPAEMVKQEGKKGRKDDLKEVTVLLIFVALCSLRFVRLLLAALLFFQLAKIAFSRQSGPSSIGDEHAEHVHDDKAVVP